MKEIKPPLTVNRVSLQNGDGWIIYEGEYDLIEAA